MENVKVVRIMQPTYEVDPSIDNRFSRNKVENACEKILNECLNGKKWSEDKGENQELAQQISEKVMESIQGLTLDRYKVIIQTNLGENRNQTTRVASQCLWEASLDDAVELNFVSDKLWCCVVIIGMYVH